MSIFSWTRLSQQLFQHNNGGEEGASRPLLTGHEAQIEEIQGETEENGLQNGLRYGGLDANRGSGPIIQLSGL